jgi:hypothetical protein
VAKDVSDLVKAALNNDILREADVIRSIFNHIA